MASGQPAGCVSLLQTTFQAPAAHRSRPSPQAKHSLITHYSGLWKGLWLPPGMPGHTTTHGNAPLSNKQSHGSLDVGNFLETTRKIPGSDYVCACWGREHAQRACIACSVYRSSVCMCCAMPLHAPCLVDVADPATAVLNLATGTGHIRKVQQESVCGVVCLL